MTAIQKKEIKQQQDELLQLLLEKSNLSYQKLVDLSVREWIADKVQLLTPVERKKFNKILTQ